MVRLFLIAVLVGFCLLIPSGSEAQTRTWDRVSGGLWSDPANWTGGDTPDSPGESAVFDRFGDFNVTLSAAGATRVDDLRIEGARLRLLSDSATAAELEAGGGVHLEGELTLSTDPVGGGVRLLAQGVLALSPGAALRVEESEVSASATDLSGDLLAGPSRLTAVDGTILNLGDLRVGVTVDGADRVAVDLFGGSALNVASLRIGADAPGGVAEVNLFGTTLTQPATEAATIGMPLGPGEGGSGSLAIVDGGAATLGSLLIRESGRVQTSGGSLAVANHLELRDGGTYAASLDPGSPAAALTAGSAELGGVLQVNLSQQATRSFQAGDALAILDAGSISGGFDTLDAPGLSSGLQWKTQQTRETLTLLVVTEADPGDFNHDGVIDAADYTVWRDSFGSRGPAPAADANGDGVVDLADYGVWQFAVGNPPQSAAAIPEPAGLVLAVLIAGVAPSRRGWRGE